MTRTSLRIPTDRAIPPVNAILEAQGIPRWRRLDKRMVELAHDAIARFSEKADPRGLFMGITKQEFSNIFEGTGRNEVESPVKPIYQDSGHLALFAVTIGENISSEISRCFQLDDFALGSMLDSAASEGTEMVAHELEIYYRQHLKETGRFNSDTGILRFSPGYCGWHISGQRTLFDSLRPGEIGITLNDSFLMHPLKSISGVVISGQKEIFDFEDVFPFCRDCAVHTCRERIKALHAQ